MGLAASRKVVGYVGEYVDKVSGVLFLSAQISASSPPATRRMQNALRLPVIACMPEHLAPDSQSKKTQRFLA